MDGYIVPLNLVPDAVFAEKMVGDGFAIEPLEDNVYSPVSGRVKSIARAHHAVTISTEAGVDILIHFGLETVKLNGEGIELNVSVGDVLRAGDPMMRVDLDVVSKRAKSLITPVLATDFSGSIESLVGSGLIKKGQPVIKLQGIDLTAAEPSVNLVIDNVDSVIKKCDVVVKNAHGIHARPAAQIVDLVSDFADTAAVIVKADNKADASSVVALMGLGVECGDNIEIIVTGRQADKLMRALLKLLGSLEDEVIETSPQTGLIDGGARVEGNHYFGTIASSGLACARLKRLGRLEFVYKDKASDKTKEQRRLEMTLTDYRQDIALKLNATKDKTQSMLLAAHNTLLSDSLLKTSSDQSLETGFSAEYAWETAIDEAIEILNKTNNARLKDRVADLRDLKNQILIRLLHIDPAHNSMSFAEPVVLYSDEFTLSDVLSLDQQVVGLVAHHGGISSHVAIMANVKNIPFLVGIDPGICEHEDEVLLLDALSGQVTVCPDDDEKIEFTHQMEKRQAALSAAKSKASLPEVTKDGVVVDVLMNIKSADGCDRFAESGADGVGLFRTEFIYYDRQSAPTVEQQQDIYHEVLMKTSGAPVIIRTLDAGGDKKIDYLDMPDEANPFLGVRGIRLSLGKEALLREQLRAIVKTGNANAAIMLPMVSDINEYRQVKKIYLEEKAKLNTGVDHPLGIMVEVPSVIMQADLFAKEVDFLSVGTNDLTQYILAMDREHAELASVADYLHPAVIRALKIITDAAHKYHKKISVCGLMAGDKLAIAILIGLGITHLSMRESVIAENKSWIRTLTHKDCQQLALKVVECDDARSVRKMIQDELVKTEEVV
ncbi:MAG: phosphoenolpyruvate--protein phosphotransferase [Francisellaceae bacterium]